MNYDILLESMRLRRMVEALEKCPSGKAVLVNGKAVVEVECFPKAESGTVIMLHPPHLYVSSVDQDSNTFTVKSTDTLDDGVFWWSLIA